jgi:hypothetical protein
LYFTFQGNFYSAELFSATARRELRVADYASRTARRGKMKLATLQK